MTDAPLLTVENLRVSFGRGEVVQGVSFTLEPGRCLAIVGESGSGKSVTARSLIGLAGQGASVSADRLSFQGQDLSGLTDRGWRRLRGKHIGFVLQDALVSLDQLRPVGREVGEGLQIHGEGGTKAELTDRVVALLKLVGIPDPAIKARQLPHELSGGQRQRALIASALAMDPKLLIADEPTTALDVTVQAQVLALLQETRERGKALILISHNLAVVSRMADDVIVMRHGEVVEQGAADQIFGDPRHEYTRRLLNAVPSMHSRGTRLAAASAVRWSKPAVAATRLPGPLLEGKNLVKRFRGPDGTVRTVVRGVSFTLAQGETLGLVGESGSGKSTVARMAMALERPDEGEVLLCGAPWTAMSEKQRQPRRRDISIVYQDPLSSFDPRWTVDRILDDSLGAHQLRRDERVKELLDLVSLSTAYRARRPLELSGGQRQRIAIARAIASYPRVVVCDEPVSALDVSIQGQILDLLGDLKQHLGISYLFISHDLGVIHHLSDRVLVLNQGEAVETGDVNEILLRPRSAYTQSLVAAVPRLRFTLAA
jgi:peptide/nickel transport system ATP-binding protein